MIDFELSEDLQLIQNTAREFARTGLRPAARDAEARGAVPEALATQFHELGFALADVPEAAGGLGLGLRGSVVIEEALGFGDLAMAMAMPAPGTYAHALAALGSAEQQHRLLTALVERGGRGGVAWTDAKPKAGTFATIARRDQSGGWRLSGLKSEVVAADSTEAIIVFAEAHDESGRRFPAAFAIDANAAGVRIGEPVRGLGLAAASVAPVMFEHVHVPDCDRLSGADADFDAAVLNMFARAGVVGAARATGLAHAAFELAREFAGDRTAFGKPIAHFQGLAFLLADMATTVEVMRGMVSRAACAIDRGTDDALTLSAMTIGECHEGAMFVANNAVQTLGGSGYMRDYLAEKWMRDAKAHMAYALPHQLCDLLVGRLGLEGGPPDLVEDAPLPQIQSVMI